MAPTFVLSHNLHFDVIKNTQISVQLGRWDNIQLSKFGEDLRAHLVVNRQPSTKEFIYYLRSMGTNSQTSTDAQTVFTKLLLDLGQVLWLRQCHKWKISDKDWVDENKIYGAIIRLRVFA